MILIISTTSTSHTLWKYTSNQVSTNMPIQLFASPPQTQPIFCASW